MYELRKWYFDFLTPQNDYVFIYFAAVRLGSATMRSLTVHLARPGKGVLLTRGIPVPRALDPTADGETVRAPGVRIACTTKEAVLAFTARDCSVQLRYEAEPGPEIRPVMIPTRKRSSILWKPLGLRYRVSGSVVLEEHRLEVKDTDGYIDYLESSCLPPFVPVRTLYWGRLSHPGLDLVFMRAATAKNARTWSALYGSANGVGLASESVAIEPEHNGLSSGPGHGGYSLRANTVAGSVEMSVRHQAVVQAGSFIEQQEHASKLGRSLLKLLTRNPRSTKFLSCADVNCEVHGKAQQARNIPMIDEYVLL